MVPAARVKFQGHLLHHFLVAKFGWFLLAYRAVENVTQTSGLVSIPDTAAEKSAARSTLCYRGAIWGVNCIPLSNQLVLLLVPLVLLCLLPKVEFSVNLERCFGYFLRGVVGIFLIARVISLIGVLLP